MQYCVITNISRNQITFYYQQKGGKILPLEFNGNITNPLYFYLNNNNFSFGTYAKQQFLNGDPNAYGNYFEAITQPTKSFNFYGNEKHIKYLLYHTIEFALNHFFNTVLYESNSIESYRTDFPLRFIFDSDIQEKEKRLVEQLFSEAGFQNFETLNLENYLFAELAANKIINSSNRILKLQSINGTLFVSFFENDFSVSKYSGAFSGLGIDPRLRITAELIYNSAISITRNELNKEDEIETLLPYAKQFLADGSAQPRGTVSLSDGSKPFVRIKMREVNEKLSYLGFDAKIFEALNNFLKEYTIVPNSDLKFVLVGEEINSAYFIDKLTNNYANIIATQPILLYNALDRCAKNIEACNYQIGKSKNLAIVSSPIRPEIPPLKDTIKDDTLQKKRPELPPFKNNSQNNKLPPPKPPPPLPPKPPPPKPPPPPPPPPPKPPSPKPPPPKPKK